MDLDLDGQALGVLGEVAWEAVEDRRFTPFLAEEPLRVDQLEGRLGVAQQFGEVAEIVGGGPPLPEPPALALVDAEDGRQADRKERPRAGQEKPEVGWPA